MTWHVSAQETDVPWVVVRETPGFRSHRLMTYHLFAGETDKAADCLEIYIEERFPVAAHYFRIAQASHPSPRWAAIAKKMNLPE